MKKKILLTAGGTATTWHFCNVIKEYFDDYFDIYITDTNDDYLVPASIYAKKFFKVPSIYEKNYMEEMEKILRKEKIDIIVPLIDFDLFNFHKDLELLKELNVVTTAPKLSTAKTLSDKKSMYEFLTKNNIATPKVYDINEIEDECEYIIKPIKGFGSSGVRKIFGKEIRKIDNISDYIIQEICDAKEITAEVYNGEIIRIFQRERVATKAGVCVKMVPVNYEMINESILKLVKSIECPRAFCIQFMKNKNDEWCITDCNLRIGAGTALSTKIGFELVRAFLASLLDIKVDDNYFKIDKEVKSVLRVYDEVIMR